MKLKRLIPALLSVIFAFAIFTAACGVKGGSVDKNALIGITVETGNVKKAFDLGEQFTSENLVVKATMKDIDTELETPVDVSNKAKIDSSAYNADKVGTYEIYVSYTHAGVTRSTSYEVKVNAAVPEFGGITVEYAEGFINRHDLTYGASTNPTLFTIEPQLIVKKVDSNGVVGETLGTEDYNVDLYLGNEKQSSWTVGGGAYSIVVSLKSDPDVKNLVTYYVVDQYLKLIWNQDAQGTVTEIDQWSNDRQVREMASSWSFTALYLSGASKQITVADSGVTYECNVEESGNKAITVNYAEANALGEIKQQPATVNINVKEIKATFTDYNYSFDAIKTAMGNPADKTALSAEYFTGVNDFLKFVTEGSTKNDQFRSSNSCIEIKGGRLQVTFQGKGYITIGFSSTGTTNVSGLALLDKDNNLVSGTPLNDSVTMLEEEDSDGNPKGMFIITGTSEGKVKFSVEEAGTYTIYSLYNGTRGCRLYSVSMKDVVIQQ